MRLIAILLLWLGSSLPQAWAAGAVRVAFLPGELDGPNAHAAAELLRQELPADALDLRIYRRVDVDEQARVFLAEADLILVRTVGRIDAELIRDEVATVRARGGRAFALGPSFDDQIAAIGLVQDARLAEYFDHGGTQNLANLLRAALARRHFPSLSVVPPEPLPESGYFDPDRGLVYQNFADYRQAWLARRPAAGSRPWVAILFFRAAIRSQQLDTLRALITELDRRGFNALPVFGHPPQATITQYLLDERGASRVAAVIAQAMKVGHTPEEMAQVLGRLDVPVLNSISLSKHDLEQWQASSIGLDVQERSWQVAGPELAGAIAPTVISSKEVRRDGDATLAHDQPIPERIERLVDRTLRWIRLRNLTNADKRIAVIYYNYPPGKENIGASYLNVLPDSLWQILQRLRREGYDLRGAPSTDKELADQVRERGRNIDSTRSGELELLVRGGSAELLAVSEYRKWFDALPRTLRDSMLEKWGAPEQGKIMQWRDPQGVAYFVFPVLRWGSLIFAPQPTRGWDQDIEKLYHDTSLPPTHQYLAFYLWLQRKAAVDAMVHVGTHATHEWQSGKEVGFTAADPGEVLVGAVPQLYPYIVDDIGEGLQAKRRGMAVLISHMTPPLDVAGLNTELRGLAADIDAYHLASGLGSIAAAEHREGITRKVKALGLERDLGLPIEPGEPLDDQLIETVEHHIKDIAEKITPFGLHTFGVSPDEKARRSTAEAILSVRGDLGEPQRQQLRERVMADMARSGPAELDALAAGLAGRYVLAGFGNDPVRSPESLPTGRNLFGFDPARLPSPAAYEAGTKLADDLLAGYRAEHDGALPQRLVINLWAIESNRHGGAMEAQIMALLGVRPRWDASGRVVGVDALTRQQLGRPRVDVTIVPSGLYRDLFSAQILLLDQAVSAARDAAEVDNPLRHNIAATRAELEARGVPAEAALRLASVRLFAPASGSYGNNVAQIVGASNSWQDDSQIADVYFRRTGFLYGQGFWGDQPDGQGGSSASLAVDLLRGALRGTDAVIHSRSSNVYGAIDGDDFYQFLGGTALAVRQVDGKTPSVLVTNMSDPRQGRHETLERFMGRELQARYLNPRWIEAMLDEGYAGARFVHRVVDALWGWQVTVPEAVDASDWQGMYETYVLDRNDLQIRQRFRDATNLLAYQALVDRMLTVINKGYWSPDREVIETLQRVNQELIAEAGVACNADSCSSSEIVALAEALDRQAAAAAADMPAPAMAESAPAARGQAALAAITAAASSPAPARAPVDTDQVPASESSTTATAPSSSASTDSAPQAVFVRGREMIEQRAGTQPPVAAPRMAWEAALLMFLLLIGGLLPQPLSRDRRSSVFRPGSLRSSRAIAAGS
ncbi:MAG: cobaltochelatase subunit CobN [Steroidobacteraceae bacterium]|nr:cobaltochelatase subunit CobN [Nevskiaceae bacterium]MCP5471204.1 cobaltochelatase subunit CobN [Nevskiaceae bacterium]